MVILSITLARFGTLSQNCTPAHWSSSRRTHRESPWRIRLRIKTLVMRRPAIKPHENAVQLFFGRTALRLRTQQITETQSRQTAEPHLQEIPPAQSGAIELHPVHRNRVPQTFLAEKPRNWDVLPEIHSISVDPFFTSVCNKVANPASFAQLSRQNRLDFWRLFRDDRSWEPKGK